MTPRAEPPDSVASPHGEANDRLPMLAFLFVVVTLILMAAVPAILLHRMSAASQEVASTILPANRRLHDLGFAMENRISSSRSRLLTEDPEPYESRLAEARAAEEIALRSYEELADRFGAPLDHLQNLRRHMIWRDSLEMEVLTADDEIEAFRRTLPAFDTARDSMLVELAGMRRRLMTETELRAAEEARLANLMRLLSILLGTAALASASVVGWSALRQRQLREEVQKLLVVANRGRQLAERHGEELERATESRARLIRGITHDVKNPLGAAKGYATLLQDGIRGPLPEGQQPLVEGIQRSVDQALDIIADLLDLARADSAGLGVERVEIDLVAVARAATSDHDSAARAAGHSIAFDHPDGPVRVFTDPGRVSQILGNLISNAIKYTPSPGTIRVSTSTEDGAEGPSWAVIHVTDSGPGIPPDQREAIFDEFTRFHDGVQKGHGLGLAIARRISRILDGDLTVDGAEGGGSVFTLRLPLRREGSGRPRSPGPPADQLARR